MIKSTKKAAKAVVKNQSKKTVQNLSNPLFLEIPSYLSKIVANGKTGKSNLGMVFVLGSEKNLMSTKTVGQWISKLAPSWQKADLRKNTREVLSFVGDKGPVWILNPKKREGPFSHGARLEESPFVWMREQIGGMVGQFKSYHLESVQIEIHNTSEEQDFGLLMGLELAAYNYKNVLDAENMASLPKLAVKKVGEKLNPQLIAQAQSLGGSVNWARHMVNTPPNFLNPQTMEQLAVQKLSRAKNLSVTIWDEKKLLAEGMNLHLSVGKGSEYPSRLIHLKYRPTGEGAKAKPIAFVGKGVTFDTGGLDIKPSSGMRLMKKDMGGSAAVLALAQWAAETAYPRPLDFYLAMAENSIDAGSFRPSDVLTARNGMRVEIHNTDAEGRLVLADALDVAATRTGNDEPEVIIDVATLTGAIKVALGGDIIGLFSNHDSLAESLNKAGQKTGELNWRMPLYSRYTSQMSTHFADIVNCVDGFGGAITAALFLEKFVHSKPWAHLDIYGWNDKPTGSASSSGGSGQAVQSLATYLLARLESN